LAKEYTGQKVIVVYIAVAPSNEISSKKFQAAFNHFNKDTKPSFAKYFTGTLYSAHHIEVINIT
jgi:hypothetical protein